GHTQGPGYITNSVWSNGCARVVTGDRDNAYPATPGNAWESYNVEQQATLVEVWFHHTLGASPPQAEDSDERFPYVRDVIRAGRSAGRKQKWTYQGPLYFRGKRTKG